MAASAYPFDCIIVVVNPASKQADIANKRIARLRKLYPNRPLHTVETTKDLEETHQKILRVLEREVKRGTPVVGIAGGDGTVNTVLQLLADGHTPATVRQVPIVPLGTGNANDLAFMLYGTPAHPEHVFKEGTSVAIRPLVCTVKDPDGHTECWVASNYLSFGAMAHGAHELNKAAVRELGHHHHWYSGIAMDFQAVKAALRAPVFRIRQTGEEKALRDMVIGNGERVAKLGRMTARIDRADMYVFIVGHTRMGRGAMPLEYLKLILGLGPGRLLRNARFSFQVLEDVRAQYDGEPAVVKAGSTVTITHTKQTFQALSTRLTKRSS
jgi:diacylglycerol kinase family enzyme